MFKLLLRSGAPTRESVLVRNYLFDFAVRGGWINIVRFLVKAGEFYVDLRQLSHDGQTLLEIAVQNGHRQVAKLLLEAGKFELYSAEEKELFQGLLDLLGES